MHLVGRQEPFSRIVQLPAILSLYKGIFTDQLIFSNIWSALSHENGNTALFDCASVIWYIWKNETLMSLKHQKYYFWPLVLKVLISLLLISRKVTTMHYVFMLMIHGAFPRVCKGTASLLWTYPWSGLKKYLNRSWPTFISLKLTITRVFGACSRRTVSSLLMSVGAFYKMLTKTPLTYKYPNGRTKVC